jgi:hypothetical protein
LEAHEKAQRHETYSRPANVHSIFEAKSIEEERDEPPGWAVESRQMKPRLARPVSGKTEAEKLDDAVRQLSGVSKDDFTKAEAEYSGPSQR